jgi:hypothetical protein
LLRRWKEVVSSRMSDHSLSSFVNNGVVYGCHFEASLVTFCLY